MGKRNPQNTLVWNKSEWSTTSTDELGFKELLKQVDINSKKIVIWGGGGVLPSIKPIIPMAQCYSASSGKPREGYVEVLNPDFLIWAATDTGIENFPEHWCPELIIDVNYHKNSGGRALALKKGCKYLSGETMFVEQALAQQKYWEKFDGCQ